MRGEAANPVPGPVPVTGLYQTLFQLLYQRIVYGVRLIRTEWRMGHGKDLKCHKGEVHKLMKQYWKLGSFLCKLKTGVKILENLLRMKVKCEDCQNQKRDVRNLQRHTERVHERNEPFFPPILGDCPLCGQMFWRKADLKQHVRTARTWEGPYAGNVGVPEGRDTVEVVDDPGPVPTPSPIGVLSPDLAPSRSMRVSRFLTSSQRIPSRTLPRAGLWGSSPVTTPSPSPRTAPGVADRR